MKLFPLLFVFFVLYLAQNKSSLAQDTANKRISKDSTPIEDLDYHLNKDQFIYYYGIDDTAKAIIRMFYRKRGNGVVDFLVIPAASYTVGGAIALVGALAQVITESATSIALIGAGVGIILAGVYIVPIYYIIERAIYTRQKLIYVLVGRERGQGIPENILENLKVTDFR